MKNADLKSDNPNKKANTVHKDRSLTYMGVVLGAIILIMGYLTLFVDDPWKMFRKESEQPTVVNDRSQLLNETSSMSDEEIKRSLIKFIEAFYYDQSRGYFDPPSYFAPITETFYNYHNLTYARLKSVYWTRRADMQNLKRNWIVSSLEFQRLDRRISATYWASETYFRPSKNEQQSADVKYELITDENGKIVSLIELETKNFVAYPMNISRDTLDTNATGIPPGNTAQPVTVPAETQPQTQAAPVTTEDNKIYAAAALEHVPEFTGSEKQLIRYLTTNSRYPLRARQSASGGRVDLAFTVEKNGEIKDVKLVKGIGNPYDDEAVRLMKLSPAWKPGTIGGKTVRSGYQMHVTFKQ